MLLHPDFIDPKPKKKSATPLQKVPLERLGPFRSTDPTRRLTNAAEAWAGIVQDGQRAEAQRRQDAQLKAATQRQAEVERRRLAHTPDRKVLSVRGERYPVTFDRLATFQDQSDARIQILREKHPAEYAIFAKADAQYRAFGKKKNRTAADEKARAEANQTRLIALNGGSYGVGDPIGSTSVFENLPKSAQKLFWAVANTTVDPSDRPVVKAIGRRIEHSGQIARKFVQSIPRADDDLTMMFVEAAVGSVEETGAKLARPREALEKISSSLGSPYDPNATLSEKLDGWVTLVGLVPTGAGTAAIARGFEKIATKGLARFLERALASGALEVVNNRYVLRRGAMQALMKEFPWLGKVAGNLVTEEVAAGASKATATAARSLGKRRVSTGAPVASEPPGRWAAKGRTTGEGRAKGSPFVVSEGPKPKGETLTATRIPAPASSPVPKGFGGKAPRLKPVTDLGNVPNPSLATPSLSGPPVVYPKTKVLGTGGARFDANGLTSAESLEVRAALEAGVGLDPRQAIRTARATGTPLGHKEIGAIGRGGLKARKNLDALLAKPVRDADAVTLAQANLDGYLKALRGAKTTPGESGRTRALFVGLLDPTLPAAPSAKILRPGEFDPDRVGPIFIRERPPLETDIPFDPNGWRSLRTDEQDLIHRRQIEAEVQTRLYADRKKGDSLSQFSRADMDPAIDRNGLLRVHAVEADRSRADFYFNPKTGVTVRMGGGAGGPLGIKEYGNLGWLNSKPSAVTRIARILDHSLNEHGVHPLSLITLNSFDNALGSMEGAKVFVGEIQSAVERGAVHATDALRDFNMLFRAVAKSHVPDATSLADMERALGELSFTKRRFLIQELLGEDDDLTPSWKTVAGLMNEPAFNDLPNGSIVGALHLDPFKRGDTTSFNIDPHPAYPLGLGGISLGSTNLRHPVRPLDLHPGWTTPKIDAGRGLSYLQRAQAMNRRMQSNRTQAVIGVDPAYWDLLVADAEQARVAPRGLQWHP